MPLYAGAYTELRETTLINPTGELPAPMPIPAAMKRLDEKDGLVALPEAGPLRNRAPRLSSGVNGGAGGVPKGRASSGQAAALSMLDG